MKRVDTSTKAVDLFGAGKHGWKDGNKSLGIAATAFDASWVNAMQEELANVIEDAGATLNPADNTQLSRAVRVTKTVARISNSTLVLADIGRFFSATTTFTQLLTAAATLGNGWFCKYRNDGTGIITIDADGSETIDGALTITLNPGESITLFCDGANFRTMGRRARAVVVYFTRLLSTASGAQAITGVGFRPRTVQLLANVINTSQIAWGMSAGPGAGSEGTIRDRNSSAAGTYDNAHQLLWIGPDNTNYCLATINSMDSDGFTIGWTKFAAPTGTADIYALVGE